MFICFLLLSSKPVWKYSWCFLFCFECSVRILQDSGGCEHSSVSYRRESWLEIVVLFNVYNKDLNWIFFTLMYIKVFWSLCSLLLFNISMCCILTCFFLWKKLKYMFYHCFLSGRWVHSIPLELIYHLITAALWEWAYRQTCATNQNASKSGNSFFQQVLQR